MSFKFNCVLLSGDQSFPILDWIRVLRVSIITIMTIIYLYIHLIDQLEVGLGNYMDIYMKSVR